MDTADLDFKEPPRVVNVPFELFHDFCALATLRKINLPMCTPMRGHYRVQLNRPLPEDMKHLTIED